MARDVGTPGIKVRPNGLQEKAGIPAEKTLEQIGLALRECGEFAADYGVQIRLEVHGGDTSYPPHIQPIAATLSHAGTPIIAKLRQDQSSSISISLQAGLVWFTCGILSLATPGANCSRCSSSPDTRDSVSLRCRAVQSLSGS